jgi:hypothetical protein
MKRIGSALAALMAIAFLSAPAFATTTLADFRGQGQALERLLERVHKHKKVKVVIRRPGDDASGPSTTATTPKITTAPTGAVEPR